MALARLQKIIALAGLASRREAEKWIEQGLVTVNGAVATLGQSADSEKDAIKVNGKLLRGPEAKVYYAFYKPRGVLCTLADPQGRATIKDFLDRVSVKVYPVGRLDFTTEGLVLLTNDGDWAEKVQKSPEVVRIYHAKVKGTPGPIEIDRVRRGGQVEGRLIVPHSVKRIKDFSKKSRLELTFVGPLSADLKLFLDHKGLLAERLTRTAIGQITLHEMQPGDLKLLKPSQAMAILNQTYLGLKAPEKKRDLSSLVREHEKEGIIVRKLQVTKDLNRHKKIGPKIIAANNVKKRQIRNTESAFENKAEIQKKFFIKPAGDAPKIFSSNRVASPRARVRSEATSERSFRSERPSRFSPRTSSAKGKIVIKAKRDGDSFPRGRAGATGRTDSRIRTENKSSRSFAPRQPRFGSDRPRSPQRGFAITRRPASSGPRPRIKPRD